MKALHDLSWSSKTMARTAPAQGNFLYRKPSANFQFHAEQPLDKKVASMEVQ